MAMMSSSSISNHAHVTAVAVGNSESCEAVMKTMIMTMMIKEEAQLSQRNRATLRVIWNFSL